jgi:hypothetical protein
MLKKTAISGVYKDEDTGALINKDNERLGSYKKEKQLRRDFEKLKMVTTKLIGEVDRLDQKINRLEETILQKSKV